MARSNFNSPVDWARFVWSSRTEPASWRRLNWADEIAFVCGCGHSGTTLMIRLLEAHPLVYAPLAETGIFLRRPLPWQKFADLRKDFIQSGKRVLAEKTPKHLNHIGAIREAIPKAKFVLMVRDGRDVVASLGHRYGGQYAMGLQRWIEETGIVANEIEVAGTLLQRYEDLITNPEGELQKICAFIGIPYQPEMLNYHSKPVAWYGADGTTKGDGRVGAGHLALRAWQVNQPIYDGRGRWQTDLPGDIVSLFGQGRAAELQRLFNYE